MIILRIFYKYTAVLLNHAMYYIPTTYLYYGRPPSDHLHLILPLPHPK